MTLRRAGLAALLLAVVIVWVAVARGGDGQPAVETPARPERLLDIGPDDIVSVEVLDPTTGRRVERDADRLGTLRADLAPLLAVRLLPERRAEFGLARPRLDVVVRTRAGELHLLVGSDNFDGTAVYAAVGDRTATILPRIATALAELVGAAPAQPVP